MFAKKYRINSRDFLSILKKGKRFLFPQGLIYVLYTKNSPRIAIAVSKKEEKTSVGRHRIKRRMAYAFKKYKLPAGDLLVFAKAKAKQEKYEVLEKEIGIVLDKIAKNC